MEHLGGRSSAAADGLGGAFPQGKLLPADVDVAGLVLAVMRVWPAVIAVMGEVNPRDTTAQAEFLKIGVDAFDPQHAGSDLVEYLVKPVLKDMQTRYARYLANGGREPTWKEVAAETSQEAMKGFSLRSTLAAKAAPAQPQPQPTTAQQQARAAEAEKLRAAAAASRKEGEATLLRCLRETPTMGS